MNNLEHQEKSAYNLGTIIHQDQERMLGGAYFEEHPKKVVDIIFKH
jgi:hypothetical protein